jgi:hypothetical protein
VKKFLLVAALGVLVFSMSGCFVMRTLTFNKNRVDPGGVFKMQIGVAGQTESSNEYPFFLFLGEAGSLPTNGAKLDTKGKSGGPVAMKHTADSDALAVAAQDVCQFPTSGKGPFSITGDNVIVTKDPFESQKPGMKANVPVRLQPANNEGEGFAIWMGTWMDDGDGTPEDPAGPDDDYFCQPSYTSFILGKGANPMPKF